MNRFSRLAATICAMLVIVGGVHLARTAPSGVTNGDYGICDVNNPNNCLAPNSSGGLPTTGGSATFTDRSGTIAGGGTAQSLAPAPTSGTKRQGCKGQNQSTTDTLWINDNGGTAITSQPSFELPPLAYYVCEPSGVSQKAFSIIGPTTGDAFMWKEW